MAVLVLLCMVAFVAGQKIVVDTTVGSGIQPTIDCVLKTPRMVNFEFLDATTIDWKTQVYSKTPLKMTFYSEDAIIRKTTAPVTPTTFNLPPGVVAISLELDATYAAVYHLKSHILDALVTTSSANQTSYSDSCVRIVETPNTFCDSKYQFQACITPPDYSETSSGPKNISVVIIAVIIFVLVMILCIVTNRRHRQNLTIGPTIQFTNPAYDIKEDDDETLLQL